MSPRRPIVAGMVLSLIAAACSSSTPAATTTTAPTTTTSATTTTLAETTTVPPTTTTTRPSVPITVAVAGDEEAAAVVDGFYGWIGDRSRPVPNAPDGLIDAVVGVVAETPLDLIGELHSAEIGEGRVAVVTVDDDVLLLADDGAGWRPVGARLTRFGLPAWYGPSVRHVLILGTDARAGQSQRLYRADSIHIASSNIAAGGGSILGFPRDTLVEASYGMDKFTHVNAVSDRNTDEMVDLAREISGLPVEGYVITGFTGFNRLVNAFGGVVVDVPFAMADEKSKAFLSKGRQKLWGANALAFSRNRHITGGDFTRSRHQGTVILAGLMGTLNRDITLLPDLLEMLTKYAWTDLTPSELLTVAAGAFEIDPDLVVNDVLVGQVAMRNGASVVILDEVTNEVTFRDLDDGMLDGD